MRAAVPMLVVFCLASNVHSSEAVGARKGDPTVTSFPAWGIELRPPRGWLVMLESRPSNMGGWMKLNTTQTGLEAAFLVDMARRELGSFGEYVALALKHFRGKIVGPPFEVGGRQAKEMTCKVPWGRMFVVRVVVCDGELGYFTFSYVSPGDGKYEEAFGRFVQSVRWRKPQAPSGHLQLRDRPVPILETGLVFHPCRPMRPGKVDHPSEEMFFGIQNHVADRTELLADICLRQKRKDVSFEDLLNVLSTSIGQACDLQAGPTWQQPPGKLEVALTGWISTKPSGKNPARLAARRYAIVSVDQERYLFFQFTVLVDRQEEMKSYSDAIDKMMRSVRRSKAYFDARRKAASRSRKEPTRQDR